MLLEMSPEEELGVTRPAKKKPWSLKRTKDYYAGKIFNMYNDAVEKKYMSKEEADKERDKYIATINSITQPENVKIWYEKSFMPLVKIEDMRKKYMKEPEPSEIKELELTPEEEAQMKGTVLFPSSTEFESPILSKERTVVTRIDEERVQRIRSEIGTKNIEQYRLMRRNDLLSYLRGVEDKEDKRIMELLTENQVERVNIIKDEHKYYLRLLHEFENTKITPIEKLEKIDVLKMFDADYYLKVKKFEEDIQKLNLKENEFLSDFFSLCRISRKSYKNV